MDKSLKLDIRPADTGDLEAINRVITAAVNNWAMAERVKRLTLPSLLYNETDMAHMEMLVCTRHGEVIGVAAWDPEYATGCKQGLLHGLYVLPIVMGQGIGRELMESVFRAGNERGLSAILVRAERVTADYFRHQHLEDIEPANDGEYPYQFRKPLTA